VKDEGRELVRRSLHGLHVYDIFFFDKPLIEPLSFEDGKTIYSLISEVFL
jgi:hypothetical protein